MGLKWENVYRFLPLSRYRLSVWGDDSLLVKKLLKISFTSGDLPEFYIFMRPNRVCSIKRSCFIRKSNIVEVSVDSKHTFFWAESIDGSKIGFLELVDN